MLAGRQYGHVTRQQSLGLGMGRGAINTRLQNGSFVAVHVGVYAIAPRRTDPIARAAAAVLACGPDAVLSHSSAAVLWGLTARWDFPVDVTVTAGDRRPPGIRTHRCRTFTRADTRRHLGIGVTSPARTLLVVAPATPDRILTRMVNDARRAGLLHLDTLRELLERCAHHPGAAKLRPFADAPTGPTRSEFEDAFLAFIRRYGLPIPLVNVLLNGYEVDALFPAHKLIVELDSWSFHRDRTAFAGDRERDAQALLHGYATIRITWERLREAPDREAERLREILSARQHAGRPTLLLQTSS